MSKWRRIARFYSIVAGDFVTWSSIQVARWLTSLGFRSEIARVFREENVSGDMLQDIDAQTLIDWKIQADFDRKSLLRAIKKLTSQSHPGAIADGMEGDMACFSF